MINMTIFGYASSSYIETSYIHGVTPGINQYELKEDKYGVVIIDNGQGTQGYTVNTGNHGTPDKVLYPAELESCHYHWIFPVGSGGYGGIALDYRGVSTPVTNYHSINIDHRSIANISDNGNAYASQIETNYNHGVTPAAHGWMYQGMSAGMSHISIIFDWGGGSYSNQNASHPNGITPSRSNIVNRGSTHICRIMESGIPGSIEAAVRYGNYSRSCSQIQWYVSCRGIS